MKWKFLLPLCLLGFAFLSGEEAEKVLIEPFWKAGETFLVRDVVTFSAQEGEKERVNVFEEMIEYTLSFLEGDPAHPVIVRVEIKDFSHKHLLNTAPSMWEKALNFFIESSEKKSQRLWSTIRSEVLGKGFEVKYTPVDGTTQISGHEEWVAQLNAFLNHQQIFKDHFLNSDNGLGNLVASRVSCFPTQPVSKGQDWVGRLHAGEFSYPCTYTLSNLTEDSVEIQFNLDVPALQAQAREDVKITGAGKGKGNIAIDRSAGILSHVETWLWKVRFENSRVSTPAKLMILRKVDCKKL